MMSTSLNQLAVDGISVEVVRKDIKNLHLGVYPPDGRVRVAVPLALDDEAVRLVVVRKLAWVKRQQARFESQSRQSQREMVDGESHYFLGRRYRLRVVENYPVGRITLRGTATLEMSTRPGSTPEQRERMLQRWYREQLRFLILPMVEKWEAILGVQVTDFGIKRMKTRWGTCNTDVGRIWLNLELAKKPLHCLEYIVVHEMVHLLERHHNDRFTSLMDLHVPQWRLYQDELNAAPLAHEAWERQRLASAR